MVFYAISSLKFGTIVSNFWGWGLSQVACKKSAEIGVKYWADYVQVLSFLSFSSILSLESSLDEQDTTTPPWDNIPYE